MIGRRCVLTTFALGIPFGFTLSRAGFSNFGEIHEMFMFQDFRLHLTFAAAVFATWLGFRWVSPADHAERNIHKGTIAGGTLFGAGWAICGACPAIAWVQLGEGRLLALATVAGIGLGTWVYPVIHRRFFGWPTESCSG